MIMTILTLFWSFCKIGFTSFGGLSMIPLINSEMVSHQWMTTLEVADIVAIAEMTPGPLGLNCATFAGMRIGGIFGAIAANLGILSPTFTVCAVAAVGIEKFRDSKIMTNMMLGVRPVCVGLILAVLISLSKTNYFSNGSLSIPCVVIGLLALYLLFKRKWSIPKVILLSAILGLVL